MRLFTLHTQISCVQPSSFNAQRTDQLFLLFDFAGSVSQRDANILALFTLAISSQRKKQFFELDVLRYGEDNRETYRLARLQRFGLNWTAFKVITDRRM